MTSTGELKNKNMIKTIEIKEDKALISFLDYVYNEKEKETLFPDAIKGDDVVFPVQLGLDVFKKHIELNKDLSKLDEEKDFLEEINKYVYFNEDLKLKNNTEERYSRYNMSRLISAGSLVAVMGRRGPAHNVLISRTKFENILEQEERDTLQKMYEVFFSKDDDLDFVLVWRSGAIDEPGCILVKNDEKYAFVSTGLHPEAQFVKIRI